MNTLSSSELAQYAQQINLSEIGMEGQLKLKNARVLCVGAGGLGCPVLLYLTAAGVGTIGIVDDDHIEASNLHRQVLYGAGDLGQMKALIAQQKLQAQNPHISLVAHVERLQLDHAQALISAYDLIVDCTDNFETRYLLSDVCAALGKPLVSASITQFEGQCMLFSGSAPCLRCLFPHPELAAQPNCAEAGVLGVLPGILGLLQTNEILKWITGIGSTLVGKLLTVNLRTLQFQTFEISPHADCIACAHKEPIQLIKKSEACMHEKEISAHALQAKLEAGDPLVLVDVRSQAEHDNFHIGGRLIPLPELEDRLDELNCEDEIVVYCQAGIRSAQAAELMRQHGFVRVQSLEGGMNGWGN